MRTVLCQTELYCFEKAAPGKENVSVSVGFHRDSAQIPACQSENLCYCVRPFMRADIHPKYVDAEIRCACGNVIKTRSTKPVIIVGICNACHPFYTGQQKFVDTAGRVDKFQQRAAKTQAAQAAFEATKKKKK